MILNSEPLNNIVSCIAQFNAYFRAYNACQKSWNTWTIFTLLVALETLPLKQCCFPPVWNTPRQPAMNLLEAHTVHE